MFSLGVFLFSLIICANAKFHPIEHDIINTFDAFTTKADVNYRLPNNTKPTSYGVTLKTYLEKDNFTFTGTVAISLVVVKEDTNIITLHARQLTIEGVKLEKLEGGLPFEVDVNEQPGYDTTTELLSIQLTSEKLKNGSTYILTIQYSGELRKDNGGFYRSKYVNQKNETRWLATTQFESTDARHAFPCYDEPALKANFKIIIEHGKTYSVVSNTEVESEKSIVNDRVRTTFVQTPIMSTYLVAFLVSDFANSTSEKNNENPTTQRVFSQPGLVNQTKYALIEGVNILKAISKYVQVDYSLPKMDQAAIPDFRAGAMENWGLATYREEMLLFDEKIHLPKRQLSITTTIAHEFAHQWFGDLVSPKWWSYIWLNEGFATIFEAIGTNLVHPEWNIWDYFVAAKVQPVLRVDANKSRPMTYYTDSQAGIANLFDQIAYAKSGSVIRMFMHALGEDTFKKGLSYYLKNNTHSAAVDEDLFKQLDAAAKEDGSLDKSVNVTALFRSWSNQTGFPLLTVTRDYDNKTILVTQEKYDEYLQETPSSDTWWVPYNFNSASNASFDSTKPLGWLKQGEKSITIKSGEGIAFANEDWVVFNRNQTGYYRVLYDKTNYDLINKVLNGGDFEKILPLSRAQIIDDLQAFVTSGRKSADVLCKTLLYLKRETSYAPWAAAKRAINEWTQVLQSSEKLVNFKRVVSSLVEPYFKKLTIKENNGDQILDKLARNNVVDLACESGVESCLKDAYSQFKEIIDGKSGTSQNVRGVIIAHGIRKANNEEINKLWTNVFLDSTSKDVRDEIISSLGNIQSKETLQKYLDKSIEDFGDKKISVDERQKIISTIASSGKVGVSLVNQFLTEKVEEVDKQKISVKSILQLLAQRVLTNELQTEFTKALDAAKKVISDADYESLTKAAADKLKWQNENLKKLTDSFFKDECTGSGAASLVAIPLLSIILVFINRINWL